jgi:hypothetical protein
VTGRVVRRRLTHPLWLAGVRVRHRWPAALLIAAGVAASAAALAAVLGASLLTEDRATARALREVAAATRTVQAAYLGVLGDREVATLDAAARRALARATSAEPVVVVQYKTLELGGAPVQLRGLDGVRRWVHLRSGRYPRRCRPELCEVVHLGGQGAVPSVPGVRLRLVGRGSLSSQLPFGRFAEADQDQSGESGFVRRTPPSLLAEGVSGLATLPALASLYRTLAWTVPLRPTDVHPWTMSSLLRELDRATSDLRVAGAGFELTAPTGELAAAAASADRAARRLLLVGGLTVALLLFFVVLAAATRRRDVAAFRQRLAWAGARRWQVFLSVSAEALLVVAAGVLVGWLLGAAVVAGLAQLVGSPAAAAVRHSAFSWPGLLAAVALAGLATAIFVGGVWQPRARVAGRSLSLLDAAAVAALATAALALARGRVDPEVLARDEGASALLLLLPGLVTFVAAVAAARLLRPVFRLLERVAPSGSPAVRTAALSLARNPGHASIGVGFFVASVALALFAIVYRATLDRGLVEEARYALPADFVVRRGSSEDALVPPLRAAPLSRYRSVAPGATADGVIRLQGDLSLLGGERRRYALLGVPGVALPAIEGWRSDFARDSLGDLAARIRSGERMALRGPQMPRSAREIRLEATGPNHDLLLRLTLLTPTGFFRRVDLGVPGSGPLQAALPPETRGGRVVGLEFTRALGVEAHAKDAVPFVTGTLALHGLLVRAGGRWHSLPADFRDWTGVGRVVARVRGDTARLRYIVANDVDSAFRPRQPTDGRAVPVIASPGVAAIAGSDGLLPLRLGTGVLLTKVVGSARRFPSTVGDFVVADADRLFVAANADHPGLATRNEVWLSTPTPAADALAAARLSEPPFSRLDVRSRAAALRFARQDPLTRGTSAALAAAAAVALALAGVGLAVLLLTDLRDSRGELFQLEAQGATTAELRRHVRARALFVTGLGLLMGIATAAALAALVVGTVVVSARGTAPEPPLHTVVDWPQLVLLCLGYGVCAAALAIVLTWKAFRSSFPDRAAALEP